MGFAYLTHSVHLLSEVCRPTIEATQTINTVLGIVSERDVDLGANLMGAGKRVAAAVLACQPAPVQT